MTLLERWDTYGHLTEDTGWKVRDGAVTDDEIRRALAIAQAYNEWGRLEEPLIRRDEKNLLIAIGQRADELLEEGTAAIRALKESP